jgi:transcriptional regulator of NAD metabolism
MFVNQLFWKLIVINETIVKRPHRHKRRRQKKKVDVIEQIVIEDSPSITDLSVHVPSSNRDPSRQR